MDAYEATRVVFSRIQNLDPENASKIMGLILIQDHGEREMIRLAFGPETLVQSVVLKARKELGLPVSNSPSSSSSSPSTPSSPSPFVSRQNSSSRLINSGFNLPSPLSIPNSSTTTAAATSWTSFSDVQNQDELISPHQACLPVGSFLPSSMNSSSMPFYIGNTGEMMDETQLQDQLSFLNDNNNNISSPLGPNNERDLFYQQPDLASSPTGGVDNMLHQPPYNWGGGPVHRRSFSVSDACVGSDEPNGGGFGWKPCMYYARGYCKNGSSCRFLHGGHGDSAVGNDGVLVGSPNKLDLMDQYPELIRSSRTAQQQRLAAAASQLMASSFPYSPKGMNILLQQQQNDSQRAAAALLINEELHKFGRSRLDRNEIVNPASRQIYLTFPADSTFREEDVTNYFSIYGPVEDVRIPYQQKRMFGFVTFLYPETVKIILAKGNPHFVCDARVLVKPYKEKGKVADQYRKQQQHQMERGEFSPCGTPTGMESRDPFDLQLGSRMFYNAQDMLWRRKLEEQADLQQALELQSKRLMNLQLLDIKKHHHLRTLSTGSPVGSPTQSPSFFNQNVGLPLHSNPEMAEETRYGSKVVNATNNDDQKWQQAVNVAADKEGAEKNGNACFKEKSQPNEDDDLPENLEHNLPDCLFASPTKASSEFLSTFSDGNGDAEKEATAVTATSCMVNGNSANSSIPSVSSPLEVSSFKSFNCQIPRFQSGHGAIGKSTGGTGGPTCPVGI